MSQVFSNRMLLSEECNLPAQDFEMLAFTYEGAPLEENGAVGPGRHVVDVSGPILI